jgi:putative transcriptional regulator
MLRNFIKEARQEIEMTQESLAEKVGVTRQTIGLIEKQKFNPTITLCLHISRALNKTLNELFIWEERKNEK